MSSTGTTTPDALITMVHLQELILCATQPTSPTSGPGTISLHDIQTGSTLASFKQTSAGLHSTAVVRSGEGMGGFVLAAQPDKAVLNVYYFQKVCLESGGLIRECKGM